MVDMFCLLLPPAGGDELHDPPLDPLQLIPSGGGQEEAEHVHHVPDQVLALTHPYCLHQHYVVPSSLTQYNCLVSCSGHASQMSSTRTWSNKSAHVSGQFWHPCLITEDAATCGSTRRVNSEDSHTMAACGQLLPKYFCKCAFPSPWRSRQSYSKC